MARVNKAGSHAAKVTVTSPVRAGGPASATTTTYEGGAAWLREPKGEMAMLGTSLFDGEDTFYEKARDRQLRWMSLAEKVALEDPAWVLGFITYLRDEGNIRTASARAAAAAVHARLADQASVAADKAFRATRERGWNRRILAAPCLRPDEPGELAAIWMAEYGRKLPMPVKRALADVARGLYTEYGLLNYDTPSHAIRFGDVLALAHPRHDGTARQDKLFRYAVDRRRGREAGVPDELPMVRKHAQLIEEALGVSGEAASYDGLLDPRLLREAGVTWNTALSLAGTKVPKRALWEALMPVMPYMAAIRNLRNMDEAGVSDEAAAALAARLADPAQVARSRQFPFRFFSAYREAPSLRWAQALETALLHSCSSVPELPGRTLILVDTSRSMTGKGLSARSKMTVAQAAALFACVLAVRNPGAELYGFADNVFRHHVPRGASVLKTAEAFTARTGEVGHGTQTVRSLRATYDGHDRVMIFTDMQAFRDYSVRDSWYISETGQSVTDVVPEKTWLYGFSLGGYQPSMMPSGTGTRHELGGLTDATFRMIPLLERGRDFDWISFFNQGRISQHGETA
jgi:TROVE domain